MGGVEFTGTRMRTTTAPRTLYDRLTPRTDYIRYDIDLSNEGGTI